MCRGLLLGSLFTLVFLLCLKIIKQLQLTREVCTCWLLVVSVCCFTVTLCILNLCVHVWVERSKKVMHRNPHVCLLQTWYQFFQPLLIIETERQQTCCFVQHHHGNEEYQHSHWWRTCQKADKEQTCLGVCATKWQIWIMSWRTQWENNLLKDFEYSDCVS